MLLGLVIEAVPLYVLRVPTLRVAGRHRNEDRRDVRSAGGEDFGHVVGGGARQGRHGSFYLER